MKKLPFVPTCGSVYEDALWNRWTGSPLEPKHACSAFGTYIRRHWI